MFWLNLFVALIIVFAVVALLFVLAIMPKMKKHEWTDEIKKYTYAHRGLFSRENKVPENSLLAFEKAIEKGFINKIIIAINILDAVSIFGICLIKAF